MFVSLSETQTPHQSEQAAPRERPDAANFDFTRPPTSGQSTACFRYQRGRSDTTTKLTRRRKRQSEARNERNGGAVGGRVQRLVVLLLICFTAYDPNAAPERAIEEVELAPLPAPRQKIVRTIEQNYREASFRRRVLTAYSHACAVCGMQLKLVDAAHIIPVYDPQSNDETSNGLCLCALHHRAMDRMLIAIAPDYRIITNDIEIERLKQEQRGDGADLLKSNLAKIIRTPPEKAQRPNPDFLKIALEIRGWPLSL